MDLFASNHGSPSENHSSLHSNSQRRRTLSLGTALRPGVRTGAACRALPDKDEDEKFCSKRDNCRHPPLPPLYLEVDMCCSSELCENELWNYPKTDEEDWNSDITESEYEVEKEACPAGCKQDAKASEASEASDKAKEGVIGSSHSEQPGHRNGNSSEVGRVAKADMMQTFIQRDAHRCRTPPIILDTKQQKHIDKPSRFTRTTDCEFKRNGLLILRLALQLPGPIATLVNSLDPTSTAGAKLYRSNKNRNLESLGYTYHWELQNIDFGFGHHYGVRRFVERFLLATLDLDPSGCVDDLNFTRRPRMILRPGNNNIVPFVGRVRSPVPDLLYGYSHIPFMGDEEAANWQYCPRPPSASSENLAGKYKNWFISDLKRDAGGELLFPFLSFEFRGFDGTDGCGDNSIEFASRRLDNHCSCCMHTTTAMGTATLECMATATASVRIVERLNRKVRALRKDRHCPVKSADETDIVDERDTVKNMAVLDYYNCNGGLLNPRLRTERFRYIATLESSGKDSKPSNPIGSITNRLVGSMRGRCQRTRSHLSLAKVFNPDHDAEHDTLMRARPIPPVAFSVAVTNTEARIYVTWRRNRARMSKKQLKEWASQTVVHKGERALNNDGNDKPGDNLDEIYDPDDCIENHLCPVHKQMRAYYTVKVASYALHNPWQHIKFRHHVENIFNWGAGPRLQQIQAAMDAFSVLSQE